MKHSTLHYVERRALAKQFALEYTKMDSVDTVQWFDGMYCFCVSGFYHKQDNGQLLLFPRRMKVYIDVSDKGRVNFLQFRGQKGVIYL